MGSTANARRAREGDACVLDTGDRLNTLHKLGIEAAPLGIGVVLRGRERDGHGEHALRAEAGIDVIKVREALEQQAGTHQKHERECYLPGDQQPTRPGCKMAAEPVRGVCEVALQDGGEIAAEGSERGEAKVLPQCAEKPRLPHRRALPCFEDDFHYLISVIFAIA
jgi:hypothetical protein